MVRRKKKCACEKCLAPKATYIKELGFVLVELPEKWKKQKREWIPVGVALTMSVDRAKSLSEKLRECVYGVEGR